MEEKTVKSTKVFYHEEETTVAGINEIALREIENMYAEAGRLGIKEVGPMQFVYYGYDEKPDARFKLEIAMVVDSEKSYDGKYKFKELDRFKCISTIHKGSIDSMGQTYEEFIPEVLKIGKQKTDQCREVYHKYISQDSPDNITEIQLGIN